MPRTRKQATERAESLRELRRLGIRPGRTVYTVCRHVSKSGMSRDLSLFIVRRGEPVPITYHVARVLRSRLVESRGHHALRVGGCGMDMGFHVVYWLGRALWPKGTRRPHGVRNGEPDTAGGYALRHEWL